jgi:predicted oxidoreductase (fatty acid repression mutant protein)
MTDCLVSTPGVTTIDSLMEENPRDLQTLLERRRTIRRLRPGPFTLDTKQRLLDAIQLTPAAFNLPPWHVVLISETRMAFWDVVEEGFRANLEGDRLQRYLDRLEGFRPGVAIALIYEDLAVRPALRDAWQVGDEQATSFVQQGLGMLQLSIWLALTAEGLVTSLQHWDWLLEDRIADFVGFPIERYRLTAAMPIGYADEPPRTVERTPLERVVSLERITLDLPGD